MVGDDGVGKTCLLISYTKNRFPTEPNVPKVFDNFAVTLMSGGEPYHVGLFDTSGHWEYDRYTCFSFYINILLLIHLCTYKVYVYIEVSTNTLCLR